MLDDIRRTILEPQTKPQQTRSETWNSDHQRRGPTHRLQTWQPDVCIHHCITSSTWHSTIFGSTLTLQTGLAC
jgi:hypothetical protein